MLLGLHMFEQIISNEFNILNTWIVNVVEHLVVPPAISLKCFLQINDSSNWCGPSFYIQLLFFGSSFIYVLTLKGCSLCILTSSSLLVFARDTVFFFNLITQPITPPFMAAPLSWIFVKIITIYFLGTDSLHFAFHQLPFLCLLLLL